MGAGANHEEFDFSFAGKMIAVLLHERIDRADEDVLAFALTNGADVDHEGGIWSEAVLFSKGAFIVRGGETFDALDVDPAIEIPEVVVTAELLVEMAR